MKPLCLIHANCQGEPLLAHLSAQAAFAGTHDIVHVVNYTGAPLPEELLSRCALFLYQHLGPAWGDAASAAVLPRLPKGCRTVCLPNLLFKGYWPFYRHVEGFPYPDHFIEDLLARGLSKREIVHIVLYTDLGRYHDLTAIFRQWEEMERRKETLWAVKLVDEIVARFRTERLFNTFNHPRAALCRRVADGVLEHLGFARLDPGLAAALPEPFPDMEQPIHPQVVERLGLTFIAPGDEFFVYGRMMSYVEYLNCYLDCRLLGETDFIGFLRLRAAVAPPRS